MVQLTKVLLLLCPWANVATASHSVFLVDATLVPFPIVSHKPLSVPASLRRCLE